MFIDSLTIVDQRRVGRDEVLYRARGAAPDGRALALVVVNISSCGLMARCESVLAEGDAIRITLPAVGGVTATIRWALGGRLGCEFDRVVPLAAYCEMLAAMVKG